MNGGHCANVPLVTTARVQQAQGEVHRRPGETGHQKGRQVIHG